MCVCVCVCANVTCRVLLSATGRDSRKNTVCVCAYVCACVVKVACRVVVDHYREGVQSEHCLYICVSGRMCVLERCCVVL